MLSLPLNTLSVPPAVNMRMQQAITELLAPERMWAEQAAKQLLYSAAPLNLDQIRSQVAASCPGARNSPVVIDKMTTGIIAILIGLLLPAIQRVREPATRQQQAELNQLMNRYTAAIEMISTVLRAQSDLARSIISNMR